jgi:polysaccharide lyase-like protein
MGMLPTPSQNRILALFAALLALAGVAASTALASPSTVQRTPLMRTQVDGRHVAGNVAIATSSRHNRPGSNLLFDGSRISDFSNQSAPGAVSEVPDPAGGGGSVFKLTVDNGDVYPATPTENPRAQLCSTEFINEGEEFWWHARFYLPKDFPAYLPSWLTVMEGPYGRPWAGPPPVSIDVNGDNVRWQRNDTYDWDVPWTMPIPRGQWTDVLYHTKFGSDGFVEMWVNGEKVTFFANDFHNPNGEAPTTRLQMATMDYSNDGGHGAVIIQNYRKVDMLDTVSVYHGATQVGRTRASVEQG